MMISKLCRIPVSVAIEDQFSSLTKDSSTFYIDPNPETEERKAIRIIQVKDGGNIIEKISAEL